MADPAEKRTENSVLFSLQELRGIENNRQEQAKADAQAREDAVRRAREDAERRVREEAERRVRDAEEARRREEEARLAVEREGQFRLEESERRARVEAEARLREQQLQLDHQVRTAKKSQLGVIAAIVAVVIAIAGGVIYKLNADKQAEILAERRANEEREEKIRAEFELAAQKREAEFKKQEESIAQIQDVNERLKQQERLRLERERAKVEAERAKNARKAAAGRDTGKGEIGIKGKRDVGDNPLEGL
jgi:hypothetical protein